MNGLGEGMWGERWKGKFPREVMWHTGLDIGLGIRKLEF